MTAASSLLSRFLRRLREDDRGAGLIEYCLLVALIALVCFSAIAFFGRGSGNSVDNSKNCLQAAYDNQPLPAGCK